MQNKQEISTNHKNNNFPLDYLKGSIGQEVVATYLRKSGYEIYPYGYENNYANITRFIRRNYSDATSTKIRSMPDLLVYDRHNKEGFLLQIKATNWKDESRVWIEKDRFDSYKKYWSEALLIIYFVPTANIYCCRINDIKILNEETLPNHSEPGYYLSLTGFSDLPNCFKLIQREQYNELSREIKGIFQEYSRISA